MDRYKTPIFGKKCWHLNGVGGIYPGVLGEGPNADELIEAGNYFRTKSEALFAARRLRKFIKTLRTDLRPYGKLKENGYERR